MGALHHSDAHDRQLRRVDSIDIISAHPINSNGFVTFEAPGLATDQNNATTGIKEDIVLLAWLIVLLRAREDGQVSYEWSYKSNVNESERETKSYNLVMSEVVASLQDNVTKIASAISQRIPNFPIENTPVQSNLPSLLLSTGSLSEASKEAIEDVIHLEIRRDHDVYQIGPIWHSNQIPQYTVVRHVETLIDTIKYCIANPESSIETCLQPTPYDLDSIWGWNHQLPPSHNFCMQDMVTERAQRHPEKVGIHSWDGDLTYGQIDQYSTTIAHLLKELGIDLRDVVPVCFEKSRWTIVAVLAVMKAGATFVLMDPTLPLARLQNMAKQVGGKIMVNSRRQQELGATIIPNEKNIVVEEQTFAQHSSQGLPKLAAVPPDVLMYMIFTSGSTGTPKGVKLSHETYTSSAIPRAAAVGYNEDSRVLDFASYAFDVSIDSMLLTLGNGGCLCIPSDEDRMNDINEVIRNMKVNYAGITPSVARILDAGVIASLTALGLGGEAASASDVNLWGQVTRIVIGYGPCECTIGCTVNSSAATGRNYISIGPGNGAAIWVADPNDHSKLMPVGAVGELLVEGPIVGQGYLNDPDKTTAAFIEDPPWLMAGYNGYAGRRGRLYKTGDLGIYDPDGSGGIVFVGRKDTQVKLRGQRVELGEIESQLKARLPSDTNVIAEVIVPLVSGGQPTLVAFVAPQSSKGDADTELESAQLSSELRTTISEANVDVAKVLPRYMVPNAYIPVNYIPVLISGKTDRKRLRQFGATVDLRQLDQDTAVSSEARELSDLEKRLRKAWSEALNLEPDTIGPDDNFFALGGTSVLAMRLVSIARTHNLEVTVAHIFGEPTLSAMAAVVSVLESQTTTETPAFAMIARAIDDACLDAAQACGVDKSTIEDIYPSPPTQEALFTFSLKSNEPYTAQRVAIIPERFEIDGWKRAWETIVQALPILRTRLARLQEPGLQQVIVKESVNWRHSTDLQQYLSDDAHERMELGSQLARYAVIDNAADGKKYMVWTVHHVLYDGWSEPLVLQAVNNALHGQPIETQSHIKEFVKHYQDIDKAAMDEYWRQELKGAVGPQFPRTPHRDYLPTPDAFVEENVEFELNTGSPFTLATLIRGAWALVSSQYTGTDDIIFGETLTGRDISLPGVEGIVGPMIATVPIRVQINRKQTVTEYLQAVQQGISARTPYQHLGWQNIRKVSEDAQYASECPTGLVIQLEPDVSANELGFQNGDPAREALHFNPYPLMLAFGIKKGGFRACASFDSSLIDVSHMSRILQQVGAACAQLSRGLDRKINEISCLPDGELNSIWQRNHIAPLSLDNTTKTFHAGSDLRPGSTYPPTVVQWVCDPRNPALLAPFGSIGELWLEASFLSGNTVDSPAWLVTGSSAYPGRVGKIQSTGDLVQLKSDGSLTFVRRKGKVEAVNGHVVDTAEIEAHLSQHLPAAHRAAVATSQLSLNRVQEPSEQELIVFVEQRSAADTTVAVLPVQHDLACITPDSLVFETAVRSAISTDLAAALKRLNKSMQDSLPSYMVPSTYVVVNRLPVESDQIDHELLNKLASKVPQDVYTRLREGLKRAWSQATEQANLTSSEDILRAAWAHILGTTPGEIDVEDNFFRRGGDSVLAMKLSSFLKQQGHGLTVADIFRNMRLGDAAKVLRVNQLSKPTAKIIYKPFSTLHQANVQSFLVESVQPQLANPSWQIQDVAPVTDTQALDIRATIQSPRTSYQYTLLYFDNDVDSTTLRHACQKLVKAHDVLRTVFIKHDTSFLQVVIDSLEVPLVGKQAGGDLAQYIVDFCKADIELDFPLGTAYTRFTLVEGSNSQKCLVLGLSHAQYDGDSLPRLLRDLETLYIGGKVVDFEHFLSYVAQTRSAPVQTKAVNYWKSLLDGSSLSVLEGASGHPTDKAIFKERTAKVSQDLQGITTANLLTASWALLLARRLRTRDVTFGGITSGRTVDVLNVENVVGPCYQFTPIRVPFEDQWSALDLLRFVQQQSTESAAYDFLGFEKISQNCAQWSQDSKFFDSIAHHQDAEDFDSIPFADSSCRVDIQNPHGDAAHPFKAVSFIKNGETHIGVVGSEQNPSFVDETLEELIAAVEELANRPSERVVLEKTFSQPRGVTLQAVASVQQTGGTWTLPAILS